MRFNKGELTKETLKVIMHDLESLTLTDDQTNSYHYNLLKNNLKDIWGLK